MMETLFLGLLGASLWQTVRASHIRTVSSFCGMVALWMVTGLTRGIALPMGALACFGVWWHHPRKIRAAGISLALVLAMTVPIAVRNHHYLGLWSPFGSGWPSQVITASGRRSIHLDITTIDGGGWGYDFMSPSLASEQLIPLSHWQSSRAGNLKVRIDFRNGSQDWQAANAANAVHGWDSARLRWENVILLMLGRSWPDNNPSFPVAVIAEQMRWVWAPLFIGVLSAAVIRHRAARGRPLLLVLIAVWFWFQAIALIAVNEGRYRKPLEGLLIAEALVLVDFELARRRLASRRMTLTTNVVPHAASRTLRTSLADG